MVYYILHSPEDFIPIDMAMAARDELRRAGAKVESADLRGGPRLAWGRLRRDPPGRRMARSQPFRPGRGMNPSMPRESTAVNVVPRSKDRLKPALQHRDRRRLAGVTPSGGFRILSPPPESLTPTPEDTTPASILRRHQPGLPRQAGVRIGYQANEPLVMEVVDDRPVMGRVQHRMSDQPAEDRDPELVVVELRPKPRREHRRTRRSLPPSR